MKGLGGIGSHFQAPGNEWRWINELKHTGFIAPVLLQEPEFHLAPRRAAATVWNFAGADLDNTSGRESKRGMRGLKGKKVKTISKVIDMLPQQRGRWGNLDLTRVAVLERQ